LLLNFVVERFKNIITSKYKGVRKMLWYQDKYSEIRTFEVLKALYELNKKATYSQLESKLREICGFPSHVPVNRENLDEKIKLLRVVKFIYKRGDFYYLKGSVFEDPMVLSLKRKLQHLYKK